MKNRLFAIGAMILMMTSCTQDELISSDKGKEPATAGSCLTLVGLSSPQTRVSIGDKTGDVYPVLWSEGDALGVFSRTAGTDINNVQSLLSDESIGQNSGVFTSDDVKMAEEGATELLISCFRHALPKSWATHSLTSRYSSCCSWSIRSITFDGLE